MAHYSMPEPDADRLQSRSSTKGRFSEMPQTDEAGRLNFESDLAELRAKLSSDKGGQLSAELSTELALEVVLNGIVEQVCLATGASGAGIILQRDREWVCRASSGSSVPELGARLSSNSGLTAECIRTREIQYCEDAEIDPRADIDACRKLAVRSVIMLPILQNGKLLGVLAAFSSRPSAFGQRDRLTLMTLSDYVLNAVSQASSPAPRLMRTSVAERSADMTAEPAYAGKLVSQSVPGGTLPAQHHAEETRTKGADHSSASAAEVEQDAKAASGSREVRVITWMLGGTVLALAVLLTILAGAQLLGKRRSVRRHNLTPSSVQAANEPSVSVSQNAAAATSTPNGQTGHTAPPIAEGGLSVYENGKEVFHMRPGVGEAGAVAESRAVEHLSIDQAESNVIYRVEPEYPESARQQGIQGPVALYVRAGVDGSIQRVRVISGPPPLADAAIAAVKQWRFKPQMIDGHPAEIETEVVLKFQLPVTAPK
jgi:TonB family protein